MTWNMTLRKTSFETVDVLGKPSDVTAGFFVSKTPVENKSEFLKTAWEQAGFEPKTPLYLKQVHSAAILRVLDGNIPTQVPTGDAILTNSKMAFLVIQVADCLPVLFFDPVKKLIGGAHAGWKGSLLGIVSQVVRRLLLQGSSAEDLRVWLGPSIRACCYEVDVERSVLFPRHPDTRRHIDLVSFNQELLVDAGVRKEKVFVDPRCTVCSPEEFPSYRRDGQKAGRIFACIALK
ncbi:MAG: peptidoglycan editing factor PgeF [candidate division Zixibacteria bacterium]|nr:peptidoglycan editing factor PgeF [candidate division Zixibacteria bacterium]MCI0595026.1 peptidoglycan editing factor PgeF [candidate division Zixibacteria bacterium]